MFDSDTLKRYFLVAGLALVGRFILSLWPAEAVDQSQSALLAWPAFLVVLLLGVPAVHFAERWGSLSVEHEDIRIVKAALRDFGAGCALAILLIVWDVLFILPRDMNVLGVAAIPSYFDGAFLVEILQHTLPLALWLGIVGQLILRGGHDKAVFWVGAILVAALEPVSQLGGPFLAGYPPAFYMVGVVFTYAINLFQLLTFRRSGFIPMLAVRLGMYTVWHIIWGPIRLQFLF